MYSIERPNKQTFVFRLSTKLNPKFLRGIQKHNKSSITSQTLMTRRYWRHWLCSHCRLSLSFQENSYRIIHEISVFRSVSQADRYAENLHGFVFKTSVWFNRQESWVILSDCYLIAQHFYIFGNRCTRRADTFGMPSLKFVKLSVQAPSNRLYTWPVSTLVTEHDSGRIAIIPGLACRMLNWTSSPILNSSFETSMK